MAYMKRRGSTYHAQLAVPLDLQNTFGRKTMERSLRTTDRNEAHRRVTTVLHEWHEQFRQARTGTMPAATTGHFLTPAQLAKRDYEVRLKADADMRKAVPAYASIGVDLDRAADLRAAISGRLSPDELVSTVAPAIKHHHEYGRIASSLDGAGLVEVAQALAISEYEALSRVVERDEGDFSGAPAHPIFKNVEPEPEAPKAGEGILDLFDRYAAENAKGISTDTLTQARRDVKLFADTVGNPPATTLTKKHVRAWKDLLLAYPVKASEIAVFRGLDMKAVVEKNKDVGKPVISDATVNRYLSAVGAFCDWLVRNDFLDRNPTEGLFQFIDKAARHKPTFTAEQMNTLFGSSLFTGALNDEEWRKPGKRPIRDHRYWIPLVMLFSGARPAEIAQLNVADVRELHGSPILHITETGDDEKSVKTKGSMRVVPIHPELVRLGFLAYRDAMAAKGEKRLFPKAERNSRGQMVADFSRDFGRFLGKLGMKEGRGLSLYSFRHGFVDALRRAGFMDEQIAFLTGHTAHTMTGQYGHLPQGTLKQRVEMIEAVAYPGLELKQLYPQEQVRSEVA